MIFLKLQYLLILHYITTKKISKKFSLCFQIEASQIIWQTEQQMDRQTNWQSTIL
jgi:hypothetical protein